jgi:hypothetical protein
VVLSFNVLEETRSVASPAQKQNRSSRLKNGLLRKVYSKVWGGAVKGGRMLPATAMVCQYSSDLQENVWNILIIVVNDVVQISTPPSEELGQGTTKITTGPTMLIAIWRYCASDAIKLNTSVGTPLKV